MSRKDNLNMATNDRKSNTLTWTIRLIIAILAVVVCLLLTVGCTPKSGKAPGKTATQPTTTQPMETMSKEDVNVSITNYKFDPATVTIKPGHMVMWTNKDTVAHTVTGDDGKWDSGKIEQGKTYSHTFSQEGKYTYHCSIHPNMKGTVEVKK